MINTRGCRNNKEYFVEELGVWVGRLKINKILKDELNISAVDWYNIHNLPKDNLGNPIIPKCSYCNTNDCRFLNLSLGYSEYCCQEHGKLGKSKRISESLKTSPIINSESFKKMKSENMKRLWADESSTFNSDEFRRNRINSQNRPEVKLAKSLGTKKNWESPDSWYNSDEAREFKSRRMKSEWRDDNSSYNSEKRSNKLRKAVSKAWEDPKYIEKQFKNNPRFNREFHGSSLMSMKLFNDIESRLKLNSLYGVNEYIVYTGKSSGDITSARLLDFYIPSLNKWIEFNGDYWHRNPRCASLFRLDPISASNSWHNDRVRIKSISNVIGTKPLVIWESDYISDPDKILNKCIDYILNKE